MSRLLLLVLFLIWLSWPPTPVRFAHHLPPQHVLLFLNGYLLLVLGMGIWSRLLARKVAPANTFRTMRRFTRILSMARTLIPAWFIVGVCFLGWKDVVMHLFRPLLHRLPVELPYTIVGTLPAFLAWMGLWWAQYPAERALREQNLLIQLDNDLPVHAPPGFLGYFSSNLRLQILFTIIPVMAIMFLRDLAAVGFNLAGYRDVPDSMEFVVSLGAAAPIFVFAPVILKRILHTEPLREPALRQRLEAICQRHRLRYRDILLWRTNHNMGNAAVMGLFPQVRYILMSDLLLETMSDEQIESVFAHEVGHVVHRHLTWYVVFVMALSLAMVGPGQSAYDVLKYHVPAWLVAIDHRFLYMLLAAGAASLFFLLLGLLSRRFERQADVFAARTMEQFKPREPEVPSAPITALPKTGTESVSVGAYGAAVFSSALNRVAAINNIPVSSRRWSGGTFVQFFSFFFDRALDSANNFLHGSISYRTDYLQSLADNPELTGRFDRSMARLNVALVVVLLACGAWCFLGTGANPSAPPSSPKPAAAQLQPAAGPTACSTASSSSTARSRERQNS